MKDTISAVPFTDTELPNATVVRHRCELIKELFERHAQVLQSVGGAWFCPTGRLLERYLPLVAALVITASTWRYLRALPVANIPPLFSTFSSASLTITTTLLGFLLTIYTIFQAIDTPRKQFLIQLGQLGTLNRYLLIAVWSLLGAAILLLSFTLIPPKPPFAVVYWRWAQLGIIFVTAFSIACSTRFIHIFLRLMVDNSK